MDVAQTVVGQGYSMMDTAPPATEQVTSMTKMRNAPMTLSEVPASTRSTEDWLIQVNPKLSGVPRTVALLFAQLTHELAELPPSVQRDNGMVKLLETKDCFVRAVMPDGS